MAAPCAQAERMTSKKFQTCVFHLDSLKNQDLETERKLCRRLKDKERSWQKWICMNCTAISQDLIRGWTNKAWLDTAKLLQKTKVVKMERPMIMHKSIMLPMRLLRFLVISNQGPLWNQNQIWNKERSASIRQKKPTLRWRTRMVADCLWLEWKWTKLVLKAQYKHEHQVKTPHLHKHWGRPTCSR